MGQRRTKPGTEEVRIQCQVGRAFKRWDPYHHRGSRKQEQRGGLFRGSSLDESEPVIFCVSPS